MMEVLTSGYSTVFNLNADTGGRTQNVLVPQQHCVVNLSLTEPGLLVSGGEDFHSYVLTLPLTSPHLSITPFP